MGFFTALDWVYRLGFGQLVTIGAFPTVIGLLLIATAVFIFIGMDDSHTKDEEKKARGDLLQSAQMRVRAYRAGLEQHDRLVATEKTRVVRKRSVSRSKVEKGEVSLQKDKTRKVSFNVN